MVNIQQHLASTHEVISPQEGMETKNGAKNRESWTARPHNKGNIDKMYMATKYLWYINPQLLRENKAGSSVSEVSEGEKGILYEFKRLIINLKSKKSSRIVLLFVFLFVHLKFLGPQGRFGCRNVHNECEFAVKASRQPLLLRCTHFSGAA